MRANFERADAEVIEGWAVDPDRPGRRVEVIVSIEDRIVWRGRADAFRADLRDAGLGDGRHAFRIATADIPGAGARQTVRVRLADGSEIPGSPMVLPVRPVAGRRPPIVLPLEPIALKRRGKAQRLAIHFHAYFQEGIAAVLDRLGRVPADFDLFVSGPHAADPAFANLRRRLPRCARVEFHDGPNRGRDIAPLLVLGPRLLKYDAVLHLHTKKSPHHAVGFGDRWMAHSLDCLLPATSQVAAILQLIARPGCAAVEPEPYPAIREWMHWGANYDAVVDLLRQLDIAPEAIGDGPAFFPAGTMFWFKPVAFRQLLERTWTFEDFPEEPLATDGTIAHAIERSFFYVAQYNGYSIETVWPQIDLDIEPAVQSILAAGFNEESYLRLLDNSQPEAQLRPLAHYLSVGRKSEYSPQPWFNEGFYLAYYADVRQAVGAGELPCGYYHYLVAGKSENRLAMRQPVAALELMIPGVTAPALIDRARFISLHLDPPQPIVRPGPPIFWIVMPRLNPDISFGGYHAFFEFVAAIKGFLRQRGYDLSIVTTEEVSARAGYFAWSLRGTRLHDVFADIRVRSLTEIGRPEISRADRFIAYSTWDAQIASAWAAATDEPRIIEFIQEYEPIFYDGGAFRVISEAAFSLPHYPVFNSRPLLDYFMRHECGIFRDGARRPGVDYSVFDHSINRLPPQSADAFLARGDRLLILYGRPEAHAARNLYEVAEIALRRACAAGVFDARWRFINMGCLQDLGPVDLGGGHRLEFVRKMSEEDYRRSIGSMDIGLSLMYAPHPGVVPYEFATTGALVVTNTYDNRSPEYFAALSANFVPCTPTIAGVVQALAAAAARVDDPARFEAYYRPEVSRWSDVFTEPFVQTVMASFIPERPPLAARNRVPVGPQAATARMWKSISSAAARRTAARWAGDTADRLS